MKNEEEKITGEEIQKFLGQKPAYIEKARQIDALIARLEAEAKKTGAQIYVQDRIDVLKEIAKSYEADDKVITFDEIAEKIKVDPDELKIMSGWPQLDEILKGFRLQQLVVVSALTKSGKTSWLMDLTTRLKEHAPLWLPFEESAEELIRKFIERGEEPPKGFTPNVMKRSTFEWIEHRVIESIAKYGTRVVIIDQLDFIVPMGADNHALRVGQAMRDLKALAKKWNVCIFIICHLVKTDMDTQPTLQDLKGSSSIGQEADTVILLWREMRREDGQVVITNNTNVSVQANRRTGKTGNVKMVYNNGHFFEQDWVHQDKDFDDFRKI
jgi:replicative DNA helicase